MGASKSRKKISKKVFTDVAYAIISTENSRIQNIRWVIK